MRVLVIGFGQALLNQLGSALPPGSVTLVEDPDLIDRRRVRPAVEKLPCVAALLPAAYHQSEDFLPVVLAAAATGGPFTAVVPALEYSVPAAALAAAALGLPGAGVGAARCLSDKIELRRAATAAGIATPRWREVFGPDDLAAFGVESPVVLKPANRHGSLGVQILDAVEDGPLDLAAIWSATVAALDDGALPNRPLHWRYLVESRMVGAEFSVEALVRDGVPSFVNVTAKRVLPGRHPVETGHVVPAPGPAARTAVLSRALTRLIAAIGFGDGILHAEWMLTARCPDDPVLIECAGRIPGDSLVELIDLAYGTSLAADYLEILSGGRPAPAAVASAAAAIRFLSASPGRVDAVDGVEVARAVPGVRRVALAVTPGTSIPPLRSSGDRIGEVLAVGPTPMDAEATAARAAGLVRVAAAGAPFGAAVMRI
ncbi:biotin carboxylase [Frankia casuarinae]|uniref:Biotin carboxylase-like n=1 Tax=Frankia casuarinae (strain DSM 45818 / CECT 9043 / HFP020203 / CcI3) TaxID=106370 RepID=Q2JCW8_FRACC|nr:MULTISPECIES: ATP-grasp domain-containing protein [Frankia]ABD10874.1 Biotin carboxylase-like [Frankia casuarinae]ETA02987.1 biotin carboxylase [Frankia sp. CcI6]EYT92848.1 biotin carboxylase [Frankia casuarinae]OAA30350.1 biotin carboxylase [Frankia casuarinae]OFB38551.1 hypothetical protein Manayef4_04935 [Frankia sp. CgIM4]